MGHRSLTMIKKGHVNRRIRDKVQKLLVTNDSYVNEDKKTNDANTTKVKQAKLK